MGFALVAALCASAQDEPPVFRTGTRLVQVDAIVRDTNGAVRGLTKDDFQILDNGRDQQVAIFSVREVDPDGPARTPLPPGMVTNRPTPPGVEPVSATVILIDRQNTYPEDQGYAREQALKYLDNAGRRELIALYSLGTTLTIMQPFTDDRDALRAAVDKSMMEQSLNMPDGQTGLLAGLTGNAAEAMRGNAFQRRADITTGAFYTIARQLEGLPGRKKLVWITAAMPLTFTQETVRNEVAMQEYTNLSGPVFQAMRIMNDANAAIYPIDPRGVFPGVLSDPGITTMIRLAEMTGGKAFYADNDLSAGIGQAVTDTDVTYTLGFYPTEEEVDGSFHSISVKVNRPGLEVRYRRGYSAEKPAKPLTAKERKGTINGWVHEPLEATHIQIRARARPVSNRPGYYAVEVVVDPAGLQFAQQDGLWRGAVELAVVPGVDKRTIKGLHQTIKLNLTPERYVEARSAGLVLSEAVKVTDNKGKLLSKLLKVVVMDPANGKAGSVIVPIP